MLTPLSRLVIAEIFFPDTGGIDDDRVCQQVIRQFSRANEARRQQGPGFQPLQLAIDSDGNTLAHYAAEYGRVGVLRRIEALGGSASFTRANTHGDTVYHHWFRQHLYRTTDWPLPVTPTLAVLTQVNQAGECPLHYFTGDTYAHYFAQAPFHRELAMARGPLGNTILHDCLSMSAISLKTVRCIRDTAGVSFENALGIANQAGVTPLQMLIHANPDVKALAQIAGWFPEKFVLALTTRNLVNGSVLLHELFADFNWDSGNNTNRLMQFLQSQAMVRHLGELLLAEDSKQRNLIVLSLLKKQAGLLEWLFSLVEQPAAVSAGAAAAAAATRSVALSPQVLGRAFSSTQALAACCWLADSHPKCFLQLMVLPGIAIDALHQQFYAVYQQPLYAYVIAQDCQDISTYRQSAQRAKAAGIPMVAMPALYHLPQYLSALGDSIPARFKQRGPDALFETLVFNALTERCDYALIYRVLRKSNVAVATRAALRDEALSHHLDWINQQNQALFCQQLVCIVQHVFTPEEQLQLIGAQCQCAPLHQGRVAFIRLLLDDLMALTQPFDADIHSPHYTFTNGKKTSYLPRLGVACVRALCDEAFGPWALRARAWLPIVEKELAERDAFGREKLTDDTAFIDAIDAQSDVSLDDETERAIQADMAAVFAACERQTPRSSDSSSDGHDADNGNTYDARDNDHDDDFVSYVSPAPSTVTTTTPATATSPSSLHRVHRFAQTVRRSVSAPSSPPGASPPTSSASLPAASTRTTPSAIPARM